MTINDFEKMVDMALADGVLTPQEQQVLIKRATDLGLSPDELQMIIDARVYEKNKRDEEAKKATAAPAAAPAKSKVGGVKKCPACGATVSGLSTNCPECGHEFSGKEASQSATALFDLLQEHSRRASKEITEFETRKNQRLEELNRTHSSATDTLTTKQNEKSTINKLLTSGEREKRERDDLSRKHEMERRALIRELEKSRRNLDNSLLEEKRQIIKNFPIPTAKEDLLELLNMAASNAYDNDGVIGPEEEVWIQKTDMVYTRIKSTVKQGDPFLDECTNVVMSLMQRLPESHKKFTTLPQGYMEKMRERMKAERENKTQAKKEALIGSVMKYKYVYIAAVVIFLIGFIAKIFFFIGVGVLILASNLSGKSYQREVEELSL